MGVKGLWQILESEGVLENCEVELTSLKGKVLAVDVSIWLYQFVKSVPAGKIPIVSIGDWGSLSKGIQITTFRYQTNFCI